MLLIVSLAPVVWLLEGIFFFGFRHLHIIIDVPGLVQILYLKASHVLGIASRKYKLLKFVYIGMLRVL